MPSAQIEEEDHEKSAQGGQQGLQFAPGCQRELLTTSLSGILTERAKPLYDDPAIW